MSTTQLIKMAHQNVVRAFVHLPDEQLCGVWPDGSALKGKHIKQLFTEFVTAAVPLSDSVDTSIEPQHQACPCLHTTPCAPDCTCVNPTSSRGCQRCCSYGSPAQQKAMAEHLVATRVDVTEHRETGPVQFGNDWPGVFLRGDFALPMAFMLRNLLKLAEGHQFNVLELAQLAGLARTLESCDVRGADVTSTPARENVTKRLEHLTQRLKTWCDCGDQDDGCELCRGARTAVDAAMEIVKLRVALAAEEKVLQQLIEEWRVNAPQARDSRDECYGRERATRARCADELEARATGKMFTQEPK